VVPARSVGILYGMNAMPDSCPSRTPEFRRIARAIEYLAERAGEQPTLADVAAAAHWSEYHFAREFRRWTGISPKQLLQQLSITAARQALDDQRSVLQAAVDAGLSGPGRLHDLFVTLEAVTPGEYKSRGAGLEFVYGTAATPFGEARVVQTERGIAFLAFADQRGRFDGYADFRANWHRAAWRQDDLAARSVAERIWKSAGGHGGPLTLWVHGSNFQLQVWRALLATGREATVSYGALAGSIGKPAASRAVGAAVGANPVAWLIPCHHVLRANGALGGYRWGLERKTAMLAWELSQSLRSASRRRPSTSRHASAGSR
jgi:AraC family transcriptional regulator of adaptative response/methylated-DNA-[protein]-cysteine methyltransferase